MNPELEKHRCFGCNQIFFDDELLKGHCDECRNKKEADEKDYINDFEN